MKNTDGSNGKIPAPLPSTVFAMNTTTAVTWKKRIITSIIIVTISTLQLGTKLSHQRHQYPHHHRCPRRVLYQAKSQEVKERLHQALLLYF